MLIRCFSFNVLAAALLLGVVSSSHAQTINAASCNASDVQAALKSVTSSTTTVTIPAGTCNWTSQVTLTVPSGNSSLTIQGQSSVTGTCAPGGSCSSTDNTIIQDGDSTDSNSLFIISTGAASSKFRLTGLTVQGGSGGIKDNGIIAVGGFSQNVRVDHNHINGQSYSSSNNGNLLRFVDWVYGVVDHNQFDMSGIQNSVSIWYDEYNNDTAGFGDDSWNAPTALGSNSFVYVENNLFDTPTNNNEGPPNDCSHGGKFVWRFNIMTGTSIQTHPTGGSGRARGCRAWEVYDNAFTGVNTGGGTNADFNLFFISSGTGVVWGNTVTGTGTGSGSGYTNFVTIHSMQVDSSTYPESAPPAGWGYCGTSAWDGSGPSGYPCIDQPGSGVGDLLQSNFPNACDVTSGQCKSGNYSGSITNQAREPIYDWMNSWAPTSGAGGGYWADYESGVLAQNRDYYLWCNASSPTGCSSFNGTAGVGSGPLASRPSTCTTGVAYWATDQGTWNQSGIGGQGQLFKCTATNTWTLFYTPYAYPHPLISGGISPNPPTNVSGQILPQ